MGTSMKSHHKRVLFTLLHDLPALSAATKVSKTLKLVSCWAPFLMYFKKTLSSRFVVYFVRVIPTIFLMIPLDSFFAWEDQKFLSLRLFSFSCHRGYHKWGCSDVRFALSDVRGLQVRSCVVVLLLLLLWEVPTLLLFFEYPILLEPQSIACKGAS